MIVSQLISSVQTVKKPKQNKKSHTPRNSTGLILMFVDNDYVSRFWQIIHFICCLEGKWPWFCGTSRKMEFHFLGMVFREIAPPPMSGDGNGNTPLSHGPLAWVLHLKLWISTGCKFSQVLKCEAMNVLLNAKLSILRMWTWWWSIPYYNGFIII